MDQNQSGNPFVGIIAKIQARKAQEQQAQAPVATPAPQGAQGADAPPNQLAKGDMGGDSANYLTSALQSIQKYIGEETTPENIQIARSLAMLLTRLIDKEHQTQVQKLPQDEAMMQTAPQGAPTGQ